VLKVDSYTDLPSSSLAFSAKRRGPKPPISPVTISKPMMDQLQAHIVKKGDVHEHSVGVMNPKTGHFLAGVLGSIETRRKGKRIITFVPIASASSNNGIMCRVELGLTQTGRGRIRKVTTIVNQTKHEDGEPGLPKKVALRIHHPLEEVISRPLKRSVRDIVRHFIKEQAYWEWQQQNQAGYEALRAASPAVAEPTPPLWKRVLRRFWPR
jgi:hypothetical protein